MSSPVQRHPCAVPLYVTLVVFGLLVLLGIIGALTEDEETPATLTDAGRVQPTTGEDTVPANNGVDLLDICEGTVKVTEADLVGLEIEINGEPMTLEEIYLDNRTYNSMVERGLIKDEPIPSPAPNEIYCNFSLPKTYMGLPVRPYPYNYKHPPSKWSLQIDAPDRPGIVDGMTFRHGSPGYEEIKSKLPAPTKIWSFIYYEVDHETFDALVDEYFGDIKDEAAEQSKRWEERLYHLDNINAFDQWVQGISADRVIDQEEGADICYLRSQWEAQLTEAVLYIHAYREADPEFVAEPRNGLLSIEERAIKGLTLLEEVECVPGIK